MARLIAILAAVLAVTATPAVAQTSTRSAGSRAVVPDTMSAPVVTSSSKDRNGKLALTWPKATSRGSKITKVELQVSPGSVKTLVPTATTTVVTGLTNGATYRFRVRASNQKGDGKWSAWSSTAVPFTKPGAVSAPRLTVDPPSTAGEAGYGTGHIAVSWSAPRSDGGDPQGISSYRVQLLKNGSVTATVVTKARSYSFGAQENGRRYTAKVTPVNRAGAGPWAASNSATPYDLASAPTNLQDAGDDDHQATLTFTTPSNNGGFPVTRYTYTTSDGYSGSFAAPSTGQGVRVQATIYFNSNSSDGLSVTLTPYSNVPGVGLVAGTPVTSGAVFKPYGKPGIPAQSGSSSGYRSVTIGWSAEAAANGRPIEKVQLQGDASGEYSADGSVTIPTAQGGESKCIQVRAYAAGQWGDWSGNMCGTAQSRSITVTQVDVSGAHGPCTANCVAIGFSVEGFKSSRTYAFTSNIVSSVAGSTVSGNVTTAADGRGSASSIAYYNKVLFDETYCVTVDGFVGCVKGE